MTASVRPILEARDVSKHYGALAAVNGVTLTVKAGETVGIGGPNGAGKTTFFDLLSGLTPVSGGQVLFKGDAITGTPAYRLFHLGMARTFQVTSGFTGMTVYENMMAALVYGSARRKPGLFFGKSLHDRTMSCLENYGVGHLSGQLVSDIPALARKKLMVATAVYHDPQVLLLDEPVGGLNPGEVDEFIELIVKLKGQGISIVFIEHVMRFLTKVADRAVIMHQGKIIYEGEPLGIAKDPTVCSVYLGAEAAVLGAV